MPRLAKHIEEQLLAEHPELKAEGLRPEVVWVHDPQSSEFQEALHRQIEAINRSPEEAELRTWIEQVSDWSAD